MLCKLSYSKHYAIRTGMKKTYHITFYVRISVKAKFLMALPHYTVVLPFLCHLIWQLSFLKNGTLSHIYNEEGPAVK
jgi:hypothetical protein